MVRIDDIMNMIDTNNPIHVQNKGLEIAESVKNCYAFVKHDDITQMGNIWENCAKILERREDDQLSPYLYDLLKWTKDISCPGAAIIRRRLSVYRRFNRQDSFAIEICIDDAKRDNDTMWLDYLNELYTECDLALQGIKEITVPELIDSYQSGVDSVVEIDSEGYIFYLEPNHPIMVKNLGIVKARELSDKETIIDSVGNEIYISGKRIINLDEEGINYYSVIRQETESEYLSDDDTKEADSVDIDIIMQKLNGDFEKTHIQGREMAKSIKSIRAFFQPVNGNSSKRLWEDCALILSERNDDELRCYLREMFEWLKDINWPGAVQIYDRLNGFVRDSFYEKTLLACIEEAIDSHDDLWLDTLEDIRDHREIIIEDYGDDDRFICDSYSFTMDVACIVNCNSYFRLNMVM